MRHRTYRRRALAQILESRRLLAADPTPNLCLAYGDPDGQPSQLPAAETSGPVATAEAPVTVSISDASVVEGNAETSVLQFDVTLSAPTDAPVSVRVTAGNESATALRVERIANGFVEPIYATQAPGDEGFLFVVEQDGRIKRLDLSDGSNDLFQTVTNLSTGGERGLLGLAFHPDFETNRLFYVYTTESNRDTLIRRYQAAPDLSGIVVGSETKILGFDQPFGNHNGGWIDFGPDGYLYIASGDGGSANDPERNAQDVTNNLLGKMLRIDVNGDDFPADVNRNYRIPPDNPFVGINGDDEIWAFGLRNPWRNSFDRQTGDLYIGDVGQNVREEINIQSADSAGGENYGWRPREGTISTPGLSDSDPPGAVDPAYDYTHGSGSNQGRSVTGGYVYRGPIAELNGRYFFADFAVSHIWSFRPQVVEASEYDGNQFDDFTDWTDKFDPDVGSINSISSFAEDLQGNLFILDYGGEIFQITEGADYLSHSETVTFDPGEQTKTVEVEVLGDRLPEDNETLLATLSNAVGATIDIGIGVGTIENDDAPTVTGVMIADGNADRSVVDEIVVAFDSVVDFDPVGGDVFEVRNRDTQELVNLNAVRSDSEGRTEVTLQFLEGPSVDGTTSLADGNYQLTVRAARTSIGGVMLDGNSDGTGGDDLVFGDQAADEFFRLYGDIDGDRDNDGVDYVAFAATFLRRAGDSRYDARFDFDRDGDVDGLDYTQFVPRFLRQLPF